MTYLTSAMIIIMLINLMSRITKQMKIVAARIQWKAMGLPAGMSAGLLEEAMAMADSSAMVDSLAVVEMAEETVATEVVAVEAAEVAVEEVIEGRLILQTFLPRIS